MISRTHDNVSVSLSFNPALVKKKRDFLPATSADLSSNQNPFYLLINKSIYSTWGHKASPATSGPDDPVEPCDSPKAAQNAGSPRPRRGRAQRAQPRPSAGTAPLRMRPLVPLLLGHSTALSGGGHGLKIHVYLPQHHLCINTNASLYRYKKF